MDNIEEFVDERQRSWCIHCGSGISDLHTNKDHVPSKCFLAKPHPHNLPRVVICQDCNEGFSLDEEYMVAFLGSVLAGSTDPGRQHIPAAQRALIRSPKLAARIAAASREDRDSWGETRLIWVPEIERVNRVVIKNARGHAFFGFGEPMLNEPTQVWSAPLETLVTNNEEMLRFPFSKRAFKGLLFMHIKEDRGTTLQNRTNFTIRLNFEDVEGVFKESGKFDVQNGLVTSMESLRPNLMPW